MLALLLVGVVMVNSAGMDVRGKAPEITLATILTSSAARFMLVAMLAMTAAALLPVRAIADRLTPGGSQRSLRDDLTPVAIAAGVLVVLMMLVYIKGVGRSVNGSERWLRFTLPGLGELSVQPSEIAKWAVLAILAWYASARAWAMHEFWRGLVPALALVGLIAGVVVLEDLGTGTLIAASACVVLLAAGARVWHFALFVPLGLIGFAAAVISNPYRLDRITAFLNPYADPKGTGYHMIQSMVAVAGGEGAGRGLGHGLQKFGYLPEDTTDFLFAIVCEELGIAGAAVVIGLFVALLWAGFAVVRRESNPMLRLLGLGVLVTLGLQAVINLAVITGLGPTKGIALPLVSAGGTGWTLTAFSLGLLIAMDRAQRAGSSEAMPTPQGAFVGA